MPSWYLLVTPVLSQQKIPPLLPLSGKEGANGSRSIRRSSDRHTGTPQSNRSIEFRTWGNAVSPKQMRSPRIAFTQAPRNTWRIFWVKVVVACGRARPHILLNSIFFSTSLTDSQARTSKHDVASMSRADSAWFPVTRMMTCCGKPPIWRNTNTSQTHQSHLNNASQYEM